MKKTYLKIALVAVCLAALISLAAFAEGEPNVVDSRKCGENLTWELSEDGTLTISGEGAMDDYEYDAPWMDEFEQIQKVVVVIEDGVTSIGDHAFSFCDALTNITIPASVKTIGVSAFDSCSSLTEISIPSGVTSIGDCAFACCERLESITIPESVMKIGENAFEYCDALKTVCYPGTNADWGKIVSGSGIDKRTDVEILYGAICMTLPPPSVGVTVAPPAGGWRNGENTFAVSCDRVCAVLVSKDGGKTYTRLTSSDNGDGSYRFTADVTTDTVIAVRVAGDVNGDGELTAEDVAAVKDAYLGKTTLSGDDAVLADVNGDGKISNADVTRLNAVLHGKR